MKKNECWVTFCKKKDGKKEFWRKIIFILLLIIGTFRFLYSNLPDANKNMNQIICSPIFSTAEIFLILGFLYCLSLSINKYLNTSNLWTGHSPSLPTNKDIFKVLAERHKLLSQLWFTISITILLGGFIYAFFHVMEAPCSIPWTNNEEDVSDWYTVVIKLLPNLFLYSIFFVALGWSLKNYKAHWHNFVTNEHRYASLCCIETIRDKTTQGIKEELDLQAAMVVLIPSETAYLEGEGEKEITAGERLLKVEEAVRELATHGRTHKRKGFFSSLFG